ncbi:MAG: hypothetical protein K0R08_2030 [Solimicrobium sp.]|jgi:hypothetical protein|nr:hypothetical protein [Solimicrobium sp.]
MYIEKLKEMFTEMVQKKDASLIPFYYHENFLLYTNGQITNYNQFLSSHEEYYATEKTYSVEYDEMTLLEQEEKVAGRMWITVGVPNELPKKLEVLLVAQYKGDKIYRLWELTYPDWSKLPEFAD